MAAAQPRITKQMQIQRSSASTCEVTQLPRGVRLAEQCLDLPEKFTRGRRALPDSVPAYWSDGHPITAHDFVYSWRRFVGSGQTGCAARFSIHHSEKRS